MSSSSSNIFHCPAYKLMIEDVKSAVLKSPPGERDPEEYSSDQSDPDYDWTLILKSIPGRNGEQLTLSSMGKGNIKLDLSLIWVQGTVRRIENSSDTGSDTLCLVITDDDKHEAAIHGFDNVPGGEHPELKPGSYVGALCRIWANNPTIMLKATKIMLLNEKPMLQTVWNDEVKLAKAFLAGLIEPVV